MSYCRFSSDGFKCDVYCYESIRGYEVWVARTRKVNIPEMPDPLLDFDGYLDWLRGLDSLERVRIGGEYDGTYHTFDTPGETADFLETLRTAGYNVPQYAIDTLREEDVH